jgi:putative phosphonate metabolism protein
MADFPRYAIYYAPPPGTALDDFGASLLGYDARTATDLPFPDEVTRIMPDWRELTRDPGKYGFHATLKPPMALADGKTEAELVAACEAFASAPRPVPRIEPVIDTIAGFIAVIPARTSDEVQQLAADVTREFDSFRAPLTAEDRARRNPEKLTPRQCEYLDRWGYPYVMDEFRFHMTLTGRLDTGRSGIAIAMLRDRFARIGLEQLAIDRIMLFSQREATSRFRIIRDWRLSSGKFV